MQKKYTIVFLIFFKSLTSQNLFKNGDFENHLKNFVFTTRQIDFGNFSGEGSGKQFTLDSFVSDWKPLLGRPEYNNKSLRSVWGAFDTTKGFEKSRFLDSLPPAFKNNACLWWYPKLQTYDTINKIVDTVFDIYRNRFEFLGMGISGVYQQINPPLLKDSTYVISLRFKTGSKLRDGNNTLPSMISSISIATTTYDLSTWNFLDFKRRMDSFNYLLKDNELDTNYIWRLIQSEFKADSAYEYMNFFRYEDAINTKYKLFINNMSEIKAHGLNGSWGYVYYASLFIDDVRLLPKYQYLNTEDVEGCLGDTVELKVKNGVGPYNWINVSNPIIVLSDSSSIKVKIDSTTMYQVMSPFDTAVVMVYSKPIATAKATFIANGEIIVFQNQSKNATKYLWDFGDRTFDTLINPIHTYKENGIYEVKLIAKNECNNDTFKMNLIIEGAKINTSKVANSIEIFPMPFRNKLSVKFNNSTSFEKSIIKFYNFLGHDITNRFELNKKEKNQLNYQIQYLSRGIYFITIENNNFEKNKFTIIKE